MRHSRLLLPILLALMVAACAQQSSYYVKDAATGQRVSTGQRSASDGARGLFTESAPQTSAYRSYAYAPTERQVSSGRGLFNSDIFGSSSPAAVSASRPQPTQSYADRSPQQAQPARPVSQPTIMQYQPPRPARQIYAQQAAMPYHPPQPQPAGYYAERYRWY